MKFIKKIIIKFLFIKINFFIKKICFFVKKLYFYCKYIYFIFLFQKKHFFIYINKKIIKNNYSIRIKLNI